jgi:hypothetical protein
VSPGLDEYQSSLMSSTSSSSFGPAQRPNIPIDDLELTSSSKSRDRRYSSPGPVPYISRERKESLSTWRSYISPKSSSMHVPELDLAESDEKHQNHPSLVFKYRPHVDAPLSSAAETINDEAEFILTSMEGPEKSQDARKVVMDGRNTLLADDKKMQTSTPALPVSAPGASSSSMRSMNTDDSLSTAAPSTMSGPLLSDTNSTSSVGAAPKSSGGDSQDGSVDSSSGIYGRQTSNGSSTSSISSVGASSSASAMRKRGRRHEIKATKDPDSDHSISMSLRIIIDGIYIYNEKVRVVLSSYSEE